MRKLSDPVRLSAHIGRFGYGLVWLLVSALLLAGCASHDEYVDTTAILARVHKGDDHQQALLAFSDAWYHSTCNLRSGTVEDIFLYGPKNRDRVTLIYVRSVPSGDRLVVEFAGVIESYYVDYPGWSEICEPPLPQAFETARPSTTATP